MVMFVAQGSSEGPSILSPLQAHAHTHTHTQGPRLSPALDSLPPTLSGEAWPSTCSRARRARLCLGRSWPSVGHRGSHSLLSCLPAPSPWAIQVPSLGPKLLTMGLSGSGPPSLPPGSLQHDPGVLKWGAETSPGPAPSPANPSQRLPWTGCKQGACGWAGGRRMRLLKLAPPAKEGGKREAPGSQPAPSLSQLRIQSLLQLT